MKIHNPRGFKLTDADLAAGWRICFLEELKARVPDDAEYYSEMYNCWNPPNDRGSPMNSANEKVTTYRTKTPPPEIDALQELVKFLS